MTALLPRLTIALLVTFTAPLVLVEPASSATAAPCAKAKKKAKKKTKKTAAAGAVSVTAPNDVTAHSIVQWKKQGVSDEDIVARASEAGYRPTPRDRARLKKARVSKSLLLALEGRSAGEATSPSAKGARPIDVTKLTNPNDIDFDSVPPPQGIPKQYGAPGTKPQPKKLDHSTRPSAPFEPGRDQPESDAPVATAPAAPSNTKRVPFTAANASE